MHTFLPTATDMRMMQRCIQLAHLGNGRTGANPLVGCVIAKHEKILAEGYHQKYGGNHAEVEALSRVSSTDDLSDATLYVNLEPCCHHGKTPPCTNAILNSGIRNVVIACSDPNPVVAGAGISILRAAGINVITGVLEEDAIRLNLRFFVNQKYKRPYVVLKWAQSMDGFMDKLRSPGEHGQFIISGPTAANLVHRWRADLGAVMVGRITAETDDPKLNVRNVLGSHPVRIVWDGELQLNPKLNLFSSEGTLIVLNKYKEESQGNVTWLRIGKAPDTLDYVMRKLLPLGVHSILVEGGADTLRRFIRAEIWDEARVFLSSSKLENGLVAPVLNRAPTKSVIVGRDILQYFHSPKSFLPYG